MQLQNSSGVQEEGNPGTTLTRGSGEQAANGMQQLLEQAGSYRALRIGDIVDGRVMRVDRDGILVNLGLKAEGFVPSREMRSLTDETLAHMKVGDEVVVYVVKPENEEGQVVLSIDQAQGEKGWRTLQRYFESGGCLEAEVVNYNRGGLLVTIDGVQGFVPSSQLAGGQGSAKGNDRLSQMVGNKLRLKVIELNRQRNRVILSERSAFQQWREQQKQKLLDELQEGKIIQGKISGICDFGAFVDLGGADGLVHLSELSWEPVTSPGEIVKVGDEVKVYVMKVDRQSKRIALSLRRVGPEPWESITDRYNVGQLVKGTVTKLAPFGAFARIEGSVEGLIHLSELSDRPIQHPKEVVKEGDVLTLKILRIEPERRRLGLSLRQAREGEEY